MRTKRWSDHLLEHPSEFEGCSVVGMFRKAAGHQPDRMAVVCEGGELTYGELDQESDEVAWKLLETGVKPGNCVAVMAGRSIETVLGILAIWKCGCVSLFLDREYPPQRNRECMDACNVREVLTLDWIHEALEEGPAQPFEERGEHDRLAAVVYTSGSTTKPKGVLLTHQNILASISNFDELGINSDDRYCCFASMMFVASVFDLSVSLCIGATLYLIPKSIRRDIGKIARYYEVNGITVTFLPPHMAKKYESFDGESPLRLLICGSEPARDLNPRRYRIAHVYASTEACAVISIYWVQDNRSFYPAGKPVKNIRTYLVDDDGNQVKRGEEGELWLSGPQICQGYLDLPLMDKSCFIPNPFSRDEGYERVYRTRDLMSVDDEGNLVFHGRVDTMVKVRGFRIELTAVDNCMMRFPGIREACCQVFRDSGGENILMGYYTADTDVDHDQLRAYMGKNLPYYMIPTGLIRLGALPRGKGFKIDRNALEAPREIDDHRLLSRKYH